MTTSGVPEGLLEDFAIRGTGPEGKIGILLVHGFTGSPAAMRPWAEFLGARGYTVRVPRLPGHGRRWEDLNQVSWEDWTTTVSDELLELSKVCDKMFIFGLSMGGRPVHSRRPHAGAATARATLPARRAASTGAPAGP